MKFSIWMFYGLLKKFQPQIITVSEPNQDIENIRLYSKGTIRQSDTMYVERGESILENGDNRVYCIQGDNYIILNETDLNNAFNFIITILEDTQIWINQINSMIAANCLLSDVLDCFSDKISFPLMVLDASQTALAVSSKYGPGSLDENWDNMLETGSLGFTPISIYNELYKDLLREKEFYAVPNDPFPYPSYNRNLYANGEFVGFLSCIQNNGPLDESEKGWLLIAWELVTNWMSLHMTQNDFLLKTTVFEELLCGDLQNLQYFIKSFYASGWEENCSKRILVLSCVSSHINMNAHIAKLFNQHNTKLYAIEYSNNIIMLVNMDHISFEDLQNLVRPTIKHSGYYGGYSNTFSDISQIQHYYMQAMLTLRSENISIGDLISCQEHLLPYIFHLLNKDSHLPLRHPALSVLSNYDAKHRTNLYRILYVYLQNQSNQTDSATDLNMHRSSLLRKISLITELTNIDLNDYHTRLHLLISYELGNEAK